MFLSTSRLLEGSLLLFRMHQSKSWGLKNAYTRTEVVDIANIIITEFFGQKVAFPQKSPTKVKIKLDSIKRAEL